MQSATHSVTADPKCASSGDKIALFSEGRGQHSEHEHVSYLGLSSPSWVQCHNRTARGEETEGSIHQFNTYMTIHCHISHTAKIIQWGRPSYLLQGTIYANSPGLSGSFPDTDQISHSPIRVTKSPGRQEKSA